MMNPTNNLYQCRLCLKRTNSKVSILAGDFPKMLEILTSIKAKENDGLPKYSCTKCAQEVKSALITKKRIIKAHKLLTENLRRKRAQQLEKQEVDLVEKKIIEALTENNMVKVIDTSLTQTKPALFGNLKNTPTFSVSQKPIEFISVDKPLCTTSNTEESNTIHIKKEPVDMMEASCDAENTNEDASLQNVIDKVMGQVKKKFTCETCSISFKDRISYQNHRSKHKKTLCHICNHLIRTDNFRKHVGLHTAEPATCHICGVTAKNMESLRGHIFYQHKSSAEQYVCEECGKNFRIKYKFELHKKKEHTGIRNFKCNTCGKAFFTNGNLTAHVNMTHKKLRPHICEFCGYGFSSSYALKTHKRQHTNEKPFKCEFCEEGFRQRVSLRSHLKSKHNIEEAKTSICKICDKGFATSYALSIHARLHMAEKCEVCSETYADKHYLNNHLRDAHNILIEDDIKPKLEN